MLQQLVGGLRPPSAVHAFSTLTNTLARRHVLRKNEASPPPGYAGVERLVQQAVVALTGYLHAPQTMEQVACSLYGQGVDRFVRFCLPWTTWARQYNIPNHTAELRTRPYRMTLFESPDEERAGKPPRLRHKCLLRSMDVYTHNLVPRYCEFFMIPPNQMFVWPIPFRFLNQDRSGIQFGGYLNIIAREIPCLVHSENIPACLDIDCTDMKVGRGIHLNDVILPHGVTLKPPRTWHRNATIASILGKKRVQDARMALEEEQ